MTLNPLRFSPELTESILHGVKWTLGAICPDPFAVRGIVVAVREVVDNLLVHADWNETPAPSFSIEYPVEQHAPRFRVCSSNAVKDLENAARAVERMQSDAARISLDAPQKRLAARLIGVASAEDLGGLGFLKMASSPGCALDVRLEGQVFRVRVDVDVPELGVQVAERWRTVGVG